MTVIRFSYGSRTVTYSVGSGQLTLDGAAIDWTGLPTWCPMSAVLAMARNLQYVKLNGVSVEVMVMEYTYRRRSLGSAASAGLHK